MKLEVLKIIFKLKEYATDNLNTNPKYKKEHNKIVTDGNIPISLADMIKLIKKSEKFEVYDKSMKNFDEDVLYKSDLHGISHNERVSVLAFSIGLLEGLEEKDLKILLEAAKYHDIGRENDDEDDFHGKRSAELFEELKIVEDLSQDEMNIFKTIVTCHSLEDSEYKKIATSMGIKDFTRCKKLLDILKDADALDRVRLKSNGLDSSYLRTESAKKMTLAAYELLEQYKIIQKEIENDNLDELPDEFVIEGTPTEEQKKFLQRQWTKFNKYKKYNAENDEIIRDEKGKLILKEGTIIHGTSYNAEVLKKIASTGILACEFFGGKEDGETYYCADFIRMTSDTLMEEMKESAGRKNSNTPWK